MENNLRCHDVAGGEVCAEGGKTRDSGRDSSRTGAGFAVRAARWQRRWRGSLKGPLLSVLVSVGACTDSVPRLKPLATGDTIVAFGDSLTRGTGAASDESYPAVLQQLTGLQVINAGLPGEVTTQALLRLPRVLEQYHPALVILCHGGNDMLRRVNGEAVYSNLEAMVDMVHAFGAELILVGVPQPRLLFLEPAEIYDRLANDRHLVYLRDVLPQLESDAGMKSDPIHLNGDGYRRLAVALHGLMQTAGAVADITSKKH
jgi:lysophospholipase L1-like esterase